MLLGEKRISWFGIWTLGRGLGKWWIEEPSWSEPPTEGGVW